MTYLNIFLRQLKNPLLFVLAVATTVSFFLGQRSSALVIFIMMSLSVFLGFWNEFTAEKIVQDLLNKISPMAVIIRNGIKQDVPVSSLKSGETVFLFPGAIVPADINLTESSNLEIDESPLTGESFPVLKLANTQVFMGTTVTKGSGEGKIILTGKDTKFGKISESLIKVRPETDFQKGLRNFGNFLVRVIVIMAIMIVVVNVVLGKPLLDAVIFSLAIAIGLTPELLPVIVTVSLANGARKLAKDEVVVRQLVAIEDLGNMDVLCTDKTGTLTEGKISLTSYFDVNGEKTDRVLDLGLICNHAIIHHRIIGDPIDTSIWVHAHQSNYTMANNFKKVAEEPFDFSRRAMYVVIESENKRELIYKGSPDSVMEFCRMTPQKHAVLQKKIRSLNESGLRVIAVAAKSIEKKDKYNFSDAKSLTLVGFLTFADNPKLSAKASIERLVNMGIAVKIITGDNETVTRKVCSEIGFDCKEILTGDQITQEAVEKCNVFVQTSPEQKLRIINLLKSSGHRVGFLGDGINDAMALHAADVGISVNTAVDVAKDAASVILLRKSLAVIADGVMTGRKIFNNTTKYILMGTSSNFGNMFSAAGASFLLPFLPMAPSQILLVNSLYDVSQLSIPTDNVDADRLLKPGNWDIAIIKKYMLFFGPLSSIYDFLTFGIMYFAFRARGPLFQTGWFIESLITEIMVVFIIRTRKIPFLQSSPSWPLIFTCFGVVLCGVAIPFTPLGKLFNFVPPPVGFFVVILFLTLTYLGLVEMGKRYLNARSGD